MARLAQASDGLDPAEDFFYPFAFLLTDRVARMTSGAWSMMLVGLQAI